MCPWKVYRYTQRLYAYESEGEVSQCDTLCMYMEIHVFSTLAYENKKEKKGNPPNHYLDKQTYIARDTWMPSLTCTCTCTDSRYKANAFHTRGAPI